MSEAAITPEIVDKSERLSVDEIQQVRDLLSDFQLLRETYVSINDDFKRLAQQMDKAVAGAKKDALADEQLRAYRLLRMENESAQNFAAGFFNRAEPLMETMAAAERTVSQQIEEAATQTMAAVQQAKQQADGGKKLMLQVQNDAQQTLAELQNKLTEIESALADLKTMQNTVMSRWNEQTQQITAANVEKAAGAAAKEAVAAITQAQLTELVDRRIRAVQSNA